MRKDEKDWMLSRVENNFVFPEKPRFFVSPASLQAKKDPSDPC